MGSGSYDDRDLDRRKKTIADTGGDTFAYTTKMSRAKSMDEIKCHPSLAINKKKIRESCDSPAHPESNAVAVIFDVTGSMGQVPMEMVERLKSLMGYFLKKGYLPDVHVLFGAVGDSTCDLVPLQIGEFEPGAQELMDFFQRVYLEGRGGGQNTESYQNAIYFMARHTTIDCYNNRGKKGYLFLFGDELPYSAVSAQEIKDLMGVGPQANISIADIIKEASAKYQIFFIIPLGTSGGRDPEIWSKWRSLLGKERVFGMERTEQVCELIGNIVGVCEGKVDVETATQNLKKQGFGNEYLGIARGAFQKIVGINKVQPIQKDAKVTAPAAKKKPLKI